MTRRNAFWIGLLAAVVVPGLFLLMRPSPDPRGIPRRFSVAKPVDLVSSLTTPEQDPQGHARKVVKTDEQWAKQLTNEQFLVTRRKETEAPFSGKYARSHVKGTYTCVCCGAELFASETKFDSGTGWPSFWRPIDPKRVETTADYSIASEPRVEVTCLDCGAHLGHVFNDGPPPTGLRFCINSASLKLKPKTAVRTTSGANGKSKKGSLSAKKPSTKDKADGESEADASKSRPESKDTPSDDARSEGKASGGPPGPS